MGDDPPLLGHREAYSREAGSGWGTNVIEKLAKGSLPTVAEIEAELQKNSD